MATSRMRPLSIGEILDAGIKVVTRHWKPLLTCMLGLTVPMVIGLVALVAAIDPEILEVRQERDVRVADDDDALLGALIVVGVVSTALFLVAFTACVKIAGDAWLGAKPEIGLSLRFGLRRAWRVLLVVVVWLLAVFGALVVLGVVVSLGLPVGIFGALAFMAATWFGIACCLSVPAVLFEGANPFVALRRSYRLVEGRWWATLLLVIVGYLLVLILGLLMQGIVVGIAEGVAPESVVANATAQIVGSTISLAISYPYLAVLLTILYFDQRVRKEGYDLQLAAEALGVPPVPDAPPAEPFTWDPPAPEQPAAWTSPAGWIAPSPAEDERPVSLRKPQQDAGEPDERDRGDWQPPQAPRGPGGL